LPSKTCDAIVHHMRKATVRDLRYRFREVESLLREGEAIQITKRKRVIAELIPSKPAAPSRCPDFLARLRKLYGKSRIKVSGAELVSRGRDRY
jgi:antitoxin (DNA-binding transcriptional repressor) of toxin-antitoxin stability system